MNNNKVLSEIQFSAIAPRLYRLGYRGLIPLVPGEKRPDISGWQYWNQSDQTEQDLQHLLSAARHGGGVGMCAGNGLVAFDLDIKHPQTSWRAQQIVESIAGPTPLVRVGFPPKTMLFYLANNPGLKRNPHGLGIEIFPGGRPATGQVVLTAIHPDTRAPYQWIREHPLSVPVAQVPAVEDHIIGQIVQVLAADPMMLAHGRIAARVGGTGGSNHTPAMMDGINLAAARATLDDDDPGALPSWLADMEAGGRHAAALAAVLVTLQRGLEPDDEDELLEALEIAFHEAKPEATRHEWAGVMQWASQRAPKYTQQQLARKLGLPAAGIGEVRL